ncbi:TMEM165/GDT1 family protein [Nitrincola alkalilacustris]|uniref:TMEM165/GDT1 family protein n=1 Tax=Nitrincola alkalilacustris TaxID=1571224 RepID=UPI00124C1E7E|nr:TMEM165/GDT1 family protein [Nitrincola alkalilacustris]
MDAFISSTLVVAIAEIGDKTQLLTLFLAARYARHSAIILGILVATLLNHGLSAWLGAWVVQWFPPLLLPWILGGSFIAVGLWVLVPDKDEGADASVLAYGAFTATCILFFLAEIGDKTQVATVIMAARFENALLWVVAGSTLGMMLANVPVAYAGSWLMQRISLTWIRWVACGLFVLMGLMSIVVYK